jgi:hypothetical protein
LIAPLNQPIVIPTKGRNLLSVGAIPDEGCPIFAAPFAAKVGGNGRRGAGALARGL